jgi:diguanylate cyclase (GGDEF)-like protein/PAS domain S-box-containing protein
LPNADITSLVTEDQRPKIGARLRQAFSEGRAVGDIAFAVGEGRGPKRLFSAHRFEQAGLPYVACVVLSEDVATRVQADLAADKAYSDMIIECAPGPYYVVDQDGKLTRWNHHLGEMTGLTDRELLGRSIFTVIHEDDRPLAQAKLLAAFAMGYAQMEVRVLTARHGVRVLLKTARRFDIGGVPQVAGFCVDVTERKEAEEALAKKNAFTDALVNSVPGAFYVVDQQGNYATWNSYLNRLTGLSNTELRNRSSLLTIAEQDRPLAATKLREAFESGYAQAELHVLTRDRGTRLYFMTARRFEVGGAAYLVGVGVDTTDRRARLQQLEKAAHIDPLTHVPNRGYFLDLAAQEFSRSRRYGHPLSLWMIDVDHFKNVNDTWGHHAGDLALQALGQVGREALRDWDIMGRMGGEEFAVLLPDTDTTQALLVAERMRQKIATTGLSLETDTTAHLTISIGVATMRKDDDGVERLLDRADHALLEAKRTGRDKVCVADGQGAATV